MKKIIILPTYNERRNIEALLPKIFSTLPDVYVLVVDDNSPDGTASVVESMREKYPHLSLMRREKKEGLGKAYIAAFKQVLNDPEVEFVVTMDSDFSHNPQYLPKMFELAKDKDMIVGSRYIKGGGTSGWELWRRILSRGGNAYCRIITGIPIHDCTGGFNIIRTSQLKKIDLDHFDLSGYAFIMELKYSLYKTGARFAEYPIIFTNRKEGESKMSGHIITEGIIAPWKMRLKK
jgi:dolichol-phosphate mannosyltransferase